MGQVSHVPCAAAAPAVPCGISKKALNIQLLFFFSSSSSIFLLFQCLSSFSLL